MPSRIRMRGRDRAERRALEGVARRVRSAIEDAVAEGIPNDAAGPIAAFAGFPRHCCGETAELIARVLADLGWTDARVIDGVVEVAGTAVPHAWVEVGRWWVDAAPEAAGLAASVWVGPRALSRNGVPGYR